MLFNIRTRQHFLKVICCEKKNIFGCVRVQLVSHAKCSATAAVDGNSYPPAPDARNGREYRRYLKVTSTGYDSYRKVDCNEASSASSELTPLETQPPVGPELEQLAEEFTQLALLGKLTKVKEMMSEKTREFGTKRKFVDIKNERQQTVNEYLRIVISFNILPGKLI